MAMHVSTGNLKAELNVTPLIDVLLVLLIIFMVIMPSLSTGLNTLVPQPPDRKPAPPSVDIVVSILGDGTIRLNQETVAPQDIGDRLRAVRAAGRVIFIRGDKNLDFSQIAEIIDIAKGVGFERVALVTQ